MELVPPRLHTAIVVTGTTGSSCGGGASTFRVSQSRRRHTIKIEFIIKLNDLASSRAHSRNYHNWKRTPLSLLTCLPKLVDRECAFMLCPDLFSGVTPSRQDGESLQTVVHVGLHIPATRKPNATREDSRTAASHVPYTVLQLHSHQRR